MRNRCKQLFEMIHLNKVKNVKHELMSILIHQILIHGVNYKGVNSKGARNIVVHVQNVF